VSRYFPDEEKEKLWHVAIKRKSQLKEFTISMLANVSTHYKLRSLNGEQDEIEYFKEGCKVLVIIDDETDIQQSVYNNLSWWKKPLWSLRKKLNKILI
jgi:alkyl hydroperoxide reductase subunit AhpC